MVVMLRPYAGIYLRHEQTYVSITGAPYGR